MRKALEEKIRHLKDDILQLGGMVEQAMRKAVDALKRQDLEAAQRIYDADKDINAKRFDIEQETLITIATQQPMAYDLRVLASILEIASELERMGDYAKGIAKITLMIGHTPLMKPLIDIPRMMEIAIAMLQKALAAFVDEDVETALAIPREDDQVDALYNQVYRELVTYMIQDPRNIDQANYLMWAAHNIERMADRVTNICERTLFVATGELRELDYSNDEMRFSDQDDEGTRA